MENNESNDDEDDDDKKLPETLTVFSINNFNAPTDYLMVNGEGGIDVTFRNR